ncbi:MAG: type II secretion system protein GspN [Pseudomonadota bacterium]
MKLLKLLWAKIYSVKYYALLFIASFILFLNASFPGENVARLILNSFGNQTGITISPEEPTISFFPSAGIKFDSAKVKIQNFPYGFNLGRTSIGFSLWSLLIFSPSLSINSDSFQGNVKVRISGLPLSASRKVDELYINLAGDNVQIRDFIKAVLPLDMDSKVDIIVDGVVNMINPIYSDLNVNVEFDGINVKETSLMGFNLPTLSLKKASLVTTLKKNEVNITKLNIGGSSEELDLSVKGKVSMKANNAYDLTMRLKIAGQVEAQFGQFLVLLPPQTKKTDGSYNFRIKGDTKTPIPQITPATQ